MPSSPRPDSMLTDLEESDAVYFLHSNHAHVKSLEARTDGSEGALS